MHEFNTGYSPFPERLQELKEVKEGKTKLLDLVSC